MTFNNKMQHVLNMYINSSKVAQLTDFSNVNFIQKLFSPWGI